MDYSNIIIPIKIIMVGDLNVGKTSLLSKYSKNKNKPLPTETTSSYISEYKIKNEVKFEIKIWDTAGQEKYKSLTKLFTKDARIAILVYSIDNEESFNELGYWLELIKTANDSKYMILGVIANKSDLTSEKTISNEKGIEYANKIGAIFKSTSAINQNNDIDEFIDELFDKFYELKLDIEAESSSTLNRGMIRYSTVNNKKCC